MCSRRLPARSGTPSRVETGRLRMLLRLAFSPQEPPGLSSQEGMTELRNHRAPLDREMFANLENDLSSATVCISKGAGLALSILEFRFQHPCAVESWQAAPRLAIRFCRENNDSWRHVRGGDCSGTADLAGPGRSSV